MTTDQEIEKSLMPMKIIWSAMLMSLAVYLIVAYLAVPGIQMSMGEEMIGILRIIFYLLAFITLITVRFIRDVILMKKNLTIRPMQISRQPAIQRYQSATIIALAMSEAIGIYGLVLFFLGKNHTDLYLLIAVSAVAMIMYRPNKVELISLMQEQDRQ